MSSTDKIYITYFHLFYHNFLSPATASFLSPYRIAYIDT